MENKNEYSEADEDEHPESSSENDGESDDEEILPPIKEERLNRDILEDDVKEALEDANE